MARHTDPCVRHRKRYRHYGATHWFVKSLSERNDAAATVLHTEEKRPGLVKNALGHGSHTIQYEIEREQLYRELAAFLRQQD